LPEMQDVVIVGGGPAGLYAGARLAAAGLETTILEEHRTVGDPVHCTGILAASAFDEFALSPASILNPLTTARFWSPGQKEVAYSPARTEAVVVVDRRAFDDDLLRTAEESGACVSRGARAVGVGIDAQSATVTLADGTAIRARACLLASGANYALHRQVGLGMPKYLLHTAQVEVPTRHTGDVELHFGHAVAPKGFGWIVPVTRGHQTCARVGVMCDRDAPRFFNAFASRLADRWGLAHPLPQPRQKILPLAPIPRTFGRRLLAIGDAAGLVKPTTGGGIYYSLLSASLAAETLTEALACDDLSADRLQRYELEWRKRLSKEFRAQLSLRLVVHRMTDAHIERLFDLARTDGVMPIVRKTARFNQHRTLILSLLKHPPVRQLLFQKLAI
jgi:digeranylgeranylglycerophospholipid reductase